MSSAMVSPAAAQGRLFVFDADPSAVDAQPHARPLPDCRELLGRFQSTIKNQKSTILASVTSASRLGVRPTPEMLPSGIAAINALTGGWPRGCLTEICGPASSGRTTLLLAGLAAATRRGEFCVLVDASDALDPQSVAEAGVELDRLLWVRCGGNSPQRHPATALRAGSEEKIPQTNHHPDDPNSENRIGSRNAKRQTEHRLEQVLHATDLLLVSGGFGLVILDLSDIPPQQARRIPLTTWFRFRRAIERTPTVLLAVEQQPIAGSCSSLLLQLGPPEPEQLSTPERELSESCREAAVRENPAQPAHARLLTGLDITAELICSRLERQPARSIAFASKTAWVERKTAG